MKTLRVLVGDALTHLRALPDESVQCCVTSPPYWGLRNYGVAGQLGLEKTPAEFVAKMVAVFAEVRRILKADGTCWINLGDSYASNAGGYSGEGSMGSSCNKRISKKTLNAVVKDKQRMKHCGLKPKDMVGIPWRVAFALQEDGWYLRSDIIWAKPNPMPESVADRPTKSHEYLFLLSKSERYYYDAESIKEPVTGGAHARGNGVNPKAMKTPDGWDTSSGAGSHGPYHRNGREKGKTPGRNSRIHKTHTGRPPQPCQNESFSAAVSGLVSSRNKRTVWTVPTFSFAEAHFATYPPDLIKPCILAGTRAGDVVLDPFGGSGTTGEVALSFGRQALLIELNPAYALLIEQRCSVTLGLAL